MDETRPGQLVRVGERTLRAQQKDAIAALISEPTISAAAAKARVDERVLVDWLTDAAFNAEYRAARQAAADEAVSDAIIGLQQRIDDAVDALTRNLTCGVPAVEVESAKAILEYTVKVWERSEQRAAPEEKRG